MPIDLKIVHAADFLIATAQGQIDFAGSKELLIALAAATTSSHGKAILLDTRSADSKLSSSDLWKLAAELNRSSTLRPGKIAVLCRVNRSSQAAFFALCAQNRGFLVRTFTSFEEAIQWLTAKDVESGENTR